MSSTTAAGAYCTACRELRDPTELLIVHVDGRPAYCVCRPSTYLPTAAFRGFPCFRVTGPATTERIEVLADFLARQEVSA